MKLHHLFEMFHPDLDLNSKMLILKKKYKLDSFHLYFNYLGDIHLDSLIVPKALRKQGIGSKVMKELVELADEHKLRIILTVAHKDDDMGTTSRARLISFYKRFGFTENKGRNIDFRVMSSMIYRPKGYKE